MDVGRVMSGGRSDGDLATAAARPEPSTGTGLEQMAEVLVEAERAQKATARKAADAQATAARQAAREAIRALRDAGEETFRSSILQACLGGVVAVARGVAAGVGASAGTGAEAGMAEGGLVGDTASEAGREASDVGRLPAEGAAGARWSEWIGVGAGALDAARPLFDEFGRRADRLRIDAQEHGDAGRTAADRASRSWSDWDTMRAGQRARIEAAGRALDERDRGLTIAIGRESD